VFPCKLLALAIVCVGERFREILERG